MSFSLAKQGAMKRLDGSWTLRSVPGDATRCVAVLQQTAVPAYVPPGPFVGVMAHMMAGQVYDVLRDLRAAAAGQRAAVLHEDAATARRRTLTLPPDEPVVDALADARGDAGSRALLEKWNLLHTARTGLGFLAVVCFFLALV